MDRESNGLDRRAFVLKGLTVSALGTMVAAVSTRAFAQGAAPAAPAAAPNAEIEAAKLIPANNPLVVALKYSDDASKAELRKAARQGVEAKDQTCANCQLYKASGTLKGTKEELGVCQMIPGGLVKGAGWCNSWVKKA